MKLRNIFALLLCALVALVSSSVGSASWWTVAQNNPTGDVGSSKAVHVVCAYPQGQSSDCSFNPYRDRQGVSTPKDSCNRVQAWIKAQSEGMTFRVDLMPTGDCEVTSFQLAEDAATADAERANKTFLVSVNTQLVKAGLDPKKLYLVMYPGPMNGGCSNSYATRNVVNGNLELSNTAIVYAIPACANGINNGIGYTEIVMIRQILSTMGLASACAPHNVADTTLVSDSGDVLAIDPTSPDPIVAKNWPWAFVKLDPGNDDYFHANVGACSGHPAPFDLSVMPYVQWPLQVKVDGSGSIKLEADTDNDAKPDQQLSCTFSCNWNLQGGLTVTLTATAAVGSRLVGWGGCEVDPTSPITCRTTANQSRQVSVAFEALAKPGPNLSVLISGKGKIRVRDSQGKSYSFAKSRSVRITAGQTTFRFVPDKGWKVASCSVPGSTGRCAVVAQEGRMVAASVGTGLLRVRVVFRKK